MQESVSCCISQIALQSLSYTCMKEFINMNIIWQVEDGHIDGHGQCGVINKIEYHTVSQSRSQCFTNAMSY